MAIDIQSETVVSLTEATKILPRVNGKRPSISTLLRWCRKGLRGVHLEYMRLDWNLATSEEALNRFFEALANIAMPSQHINVSVLPGAWRTGAVRCALEKRLGYWLDRNRVQCCSATIETRVPSSRMETAFSIFRPKLE